VEDVKIALDAATGDDFLATFEVPNISVSLLS